MLSYDSLVTGSWRTSSADVRLNQFSSALLVNALFLLSSPSVWVDYDLYADEIESLIAETENQIVTAVGGGGGVAQIHYFTNQTSLTLPAVGNVIRLHLSMNTSGGAFIYTRLNDDDRAVYSSTGTSATDGSQYISQSVNFFNIATRTAPGNVADSVASVTFICDGTTSSMVAVGGRTYTARTNVASGHAFIDSINSVQIFNSNASTMTGYAIIESLSAS